MYVWDQGKTEAAICAEVRAMANDYRRLRDEYNKLERMHARLRDALRIAVGKYVRGTDGIVTSADYWVEMEACLTQAHKEHEEFTKVVAAMQHNS